MRVLRAAVYVTFVLAGGGCARPTVVYMQPASVYGSQPQVYAPSPVYGPQPQVYAPSPVYGPQPQVYAPSQAYGPQQAYQPAQPQAYPADPVGSPYDAMAAAGAGYQQAAYPGYGYGEPPYTLDAGDRVRVTVFGQEGLNSSYVVDPSGLITLPLAGAVQARGLSKDQLAQAITEKLKQGYIREPHVAVEIETYRPFFILGEVNNPGQYPYVANMSVETAVAIAGGYTARADRRKVTVTRSVNGQSYRGALPPNSGLRPGDTVEIPERWF